MTFDMGLELDYLAEQLADAVGLSWWAMTLYERDYWRTVAKRAAELRPLVTGDAAEVLGLMREATDA